MSGAVLPSYYIAHGGGPWAYMDGEFRAIHAELERSLAVMYLSADIPVPAA